MSAPYQMASMSYLVRIYTFSSKRQITLLGLNGQMTRAVIFTPVPLYDTYIWV